MIYYEQSHSIDREVRLLFPLPCSLLPRNTHGCRHLIYNNCIVLSGFNCSGLSRKAKYRFIPSLKTSVAHGIIWFCYYGSIPQLVTESWRKRPRIKIKEPWSKTKQLKVVTNVKVPSEVGVFCRSGFLWLILWSCVILLYIYSNICK